MNNNSCNNANNKLSHKRSLPDRVAQEFNCPLCLDVQVQSVSCVPCGHGYCQQCIASRPECPLCRCLIQTTVPCRTVDQAIAAFMQEGGYFTEQDEEYYKERISILQPLATIAHDSHTTAAHDANATLLLSDDHQLQQQQQVQQQTSRRARKRMRTTGTTIDTAICID